VNVDGLARGASDGQVWLGVLGGKVQFKMVLTCREQSEDLVWWTFGLAERLTTHDQIDIEFKLRVRDSRYPYFGVLFQGECDVSRSVFKVINSIPF